MSQKEKDYIANCQEKNVRSQRSEIDYGKILAGEKIDYDISDEKRDFKNVFGKQENGQDILKIVRQGF